MLVVLFAIALIGLSLLVASLVGVLAGILTGVALLNAGVMVLRLRPRGQGAAPVGGERWRPKSFPTPPEPPEPDSQEQAPPLTVRRR